MRTVRLGAALCVLIATIGTLVAQEDGTPIPQSAWTLTFVDSQETTAANNAALNAFDGSPTTFWATQWLAAQPSHPHEIRLDLGSVYNVSAFRHLPRQDGFPHGRIAQYEFYVSLDGVSWGTPVAVGTLANVATEQEVAFAPKTGQYVRLRALSEVEGRPYTSLAELNVLTSGNLPPNGVIQAPAGNVTIAPGGTVDFNGTGSDPENNLPLTYQWNFGNGSTSTLADPPAVQYVNPGTYTVTFTVRDTLGNADPVPATRTVTVQSGAPSYDVISQSGWTLRFVDSQETQGASNAAQKAFDSNPTTFWSTQWLAAQPSHPHEIQIDLGSVYNVSAFRHLPRQDGFPHGRIAQYEFYVSLDGVNWGTPVAVGTLANVATEQEVAFAPKAGQYVRLRALSEVEGRPFTSLAELNVLTSGMTSGNLPPNGVIQAPAGNVTIAPGGTVDFNGTGSDPENNLPLTYQWNFGNGSTSTLADPPAVQYVNPGTYTVTFTVRDALGNADPVPATRTVTVQSGAPSYDVISQSGWTLRFVDSQETQGANNAALNAFDGNPTTFWSTQWLAAQPSHPHEIQIDLGSVYNVSAFRHLPRQDGFPHGRIAQYEFYVSLDGVNWGAPVAVGTLANVATEQEVAFAPKTGQYVRLRALSEVEGRPYTSLAELNVLTSGNLPPNGVIQAPAGNVTIAPGGTVDFNGTGSDPENNLPLTYQWNFGNGSTSTLADPPAVQYVNPGTYTVTFTVRDALGNADPVPATRTVTVQSGAPSYDMISQSGWTLRFVDSQETQGANNAAVNAFDGNPNTFWATRWYLSQPSPPHEIQIDLGATYDVAGFRYVPRQDAQYGRIGEYQFFVSSDGSNWGNPVAAGAFPDTNSLSPRDVFFTPKTGRYVRMQEISSAEGDPYAIIAELMIFRRSASPNQAPSATIMSPAQNLTIPAGGVVSLSGFGSDPDGNLPLTYRWSVPPGSGVRDSTENAPGFLQFDNSGTYVVSFTVADALGAASVATRTITVVPGATEATQAGWTLRYVDSEETTGANNAAVNAFDGNPNTFWATRWLGSQPPPPHEIQIDLGTIRQLSGFRYLTRQDGFTEGTIGHYEFYVSTDGSNWGAPVARGTFSAGQAAKDVFFAQRSARYVRLRALSEVFGQPYTTVAELRVLDKQCTAAITPSVRLLKPRSRQMQTSSSLDVELDACVTAGQGVRVLIDGGTANGGRQVDLFSSPYVTAFAGLTNAEHVVEAFVINGNGSSVAGTSTYDYANPVGIGDYYIALGDGLSFGFGDNISTDDNSLDNRTTRGGGYTAILGNLLTQENGYPVFVANEAVGGTSPRDTLAAISAVLAAHPNAQRVLLMHGHNAYLRDQSASGVNLQPGDPGYDGSFKDTMQRIIDAVRQAGKTVILAKATPALPLDGNVNIAIQQYNMVIDELAQDPDNAIPVGPVDFYSYFVTRTTTHYSDDILLNGIGYQSMAQLWKQSLAP